MAQKGKILVVEDNDLNREVVEFILKNNNLEFISVKNGLDAVDVYSDTEPNEISMILMDLMMPNMDGIEATKIIRGLNRPDAWEIPIIAMTAKTFKEDIQECFDAGMNAHVSKPIQVNSFMNVINQFLEN